MGRTVIKESMFSEIIDLYNSQGRTAAYDLIRSKYGVKNPYSTLTRIKRSGIYTYDPDTDQFVGGMGKSSPDAVFMDLDELCGTSIVETGRCAGEETVIRRSSMEMLVRVHFAGYSGLRCVSQRSRCEHPTVGRRTRHRPLDGCFYSLFFDSIITV